MKLLGWMHRKFRQNSCEPFKDFAIGTVLSAHLLLSCAGRRTSIKPDSSSWCHSCNCISAQPSSYDQEEYYPKPSNGLRPSRQPQKEEQTTRKSFAGLEAATVDVEDFKEPSTAISELFHGLLAIGTLGSDPVVAEPATPTFAISIENITEKETEATENDLKLINEELEKTLVAEAKEDGYSISSGRSSTVSTKQMEGTDSNGINGTSTCPLQEYLFGSPIELPTAKVAKKEHRTTLGELFQRSKIGDGNSEGKWEREEKQEEKEVEKSGVHLIKKMLKRRMLNDASSRSSTAATDSVSAEKKLHKILRVFYRKVHPKSFTVTKKSSKSHEYETQDNNCTRECYSNGDRSPPDDDDTMIFPQRAISKEGIRRNMNRSNPPQITLNSSKSSGNRECWIKTDAEYLVLEL